MKKFPFSNYLTKLKDNHLLVGQSLVEEQLLPSLVDLVSYDSRNVQAGTIFVCKGLGFQEKYLDMAIAKGAMAYISEKDYVKDIPCLLVANVQKALSLMAQVYYNYPSQKLKLIGITGTKGKTTTVNYLKYILDEYLLDNNLPRAGIVTTDSVFDGLRQSSSHLTTPESLDLQEIFYNTAQNTSYMIVEVSSQALKYGRVYGVHFDVGAFLNISEDHISPVEHQSFEDYFTSKLALFAQCSVACFNLQAEPIKRIEMAARKAQKIITFALEQRADVQGSNLRSDAFGSSFEVWTSRFEQQFNLKMPGKFNIENALAAIAIAESMEIPVEYMVAGLQKAQVAGRMERHASKDGHKVVIVDYAHNKLSFNQLYAAVRQQYPERKIMTVFGCPGEKAIIRRRDLGLIAGLQSDDIILTMEDPGKKNVRKICEEIAQYVQLNNDSYQIIEDRTEAIKQAILSPASDRVVLITGKGNERYQRVGRENIQYPSDVDNALRFLQEYDASR